MVAEQLFRTVTSRLDALPHDAPRTALTVVTQCALSVHELVAVQRPTLLHVRPLPQTPQDPPQPSEPQTRATQLRTHPVTHCPASLHV